jgi:60 kDa SS-A/Ro ribonucleoprotein
MLGFLAGKEPLPEAKWKELASPKYYCFDHLPGSVQDYVRFKKDPVERVPRVPFQYLTNLQLTTQQWAQVALAGQWHQTRINLNTYARHGVFSVPGTAELIAAKLRDQEVIRKANVFPYQLLAAYLNVGSDVPTVVKEALQDAMEIATENVPTFEGKTLIFVDVSGSMGGPITGYRRGATTTIRCVDVAALIASTILRKNPHSELVLFDTRLHDAELNPRDTVLTNAKRMASFGGGGTHCSLPLQQVNKVRGLADLIVYVSDYESWFETATGWLGMHGTQTLSEWNSFKSRNPNAKMVCINLTPSRSSQVTERPDILNVGGFSDNMFKVIKGFAEGRHSPNFWVEEINNVELP